MHLTAFLHLAFLLATKVVSTLATVHNLNTAMTTPGQHTFVISSATSVDITQASQWSISVSDDWDVRYLTIWIFEAWFIRVLRYLDHFLYMHASSISSLHPFQSIVSYASIYTSLTIIIMSIMYPSVKRGWSYRSIYILICRRWNCGLGKGEICQ